MQLLEEKKQYVKCNILFKFKQLSLLVICLVVSALFSIAFAIVKHNSGLCISLFFTIALLISVLAVFFKIKSSSGKLWERTFGQITCFNTLIEIDNERISIKREGLERVTTKQLTDITKIEKFGATIVILFSDNTSVVLSRTAQNEDFERLLANEQIKLKMSLSKKSFVNRMSILLNVCNVLVAYFLSFILSDALTLGNVAWIQYSYIMYFFAIVPLALLIASIILKSKQGAGFAIVAIVFIALFGSFRFVFDSQISYDTSILNYLEYRIDYELPEAERLITTDGFYFFESIGKFQEDAVVDFEKAIKNDNNWLIELKLDTSNSVNNAVLNEMKNYNYFLLYDESGQYYCNSQDNFDWNNCILMAYSSNTHSFKILYDFQRLDIT